MNKSYPELYPFFLIVILFDSHLLILIDVEVRI